MKPRTKGPPGLPEHAERQQERVTHIADDFCHCQASSILPFMADDLAAGRLVTPFPDISLPARSYFAYLPEARSTDPHIAVFCDWLEH